MSQPKPPVTTLDKEKHYLLPLLVSFIIATLSGAITYFYPAHAIWLQWTVLAHTLAGLLLSLAAPIYLLVHFRRTLGIRRVSVIFSGWLILFLIVAMILSGLHILIVGRSEALLWIYHVHLSSTTLLVILSGLHLYLHARNPKSGSKRQSNQSFATINRKTLQLTGVITFIGAMGVIGLSFAYQSTYTLPDPAPVKPYQWDYGQHPFRPSQTETADQTFIAERHIGKSEDCADCHQAITHQWKSSMHAQAASDMAYVTNVSLLAKKQGIAATRYCEGCHAPIALLTGQLTEGGKHGGIENTAANIEGVSCRSCHSISAAVHLKGVASYRFEPEQDYLFANRSNTTERRLNNFLIRMKPDQHKRDMARPILKSPKLCATCHVQFIDKDVNHWGWIKMQDEYSAWLNSPYSGQSDQLFMNKEIQRCHDCHMPKQVIIDPSADSQGLGVSHHTPAANTAIPWINGDHEQYEASKRFLQSGVVRLSIQETWRDEVTQSSQTLSEDLRSTTNTPYYVYLGETQTLKIAITNTGVGHDFPGGTIDINQVWLAIRITDGRGQVIYENGELDKQGHLGNNAYQYRSIPVDKQGNHVWKHDLFNMVGKSYRNVIKAGETDVIDVPVTIPNWAKGPITISAVLRYRKFSQRYAEWALKKNTRWPLPIIDVAHDALQISLRRRPKVE